MDYGGKHIVENVNVSPEDGGVFKSDSLNAPNPSVNASKPVKMIGSYPDPLAGKSGKDSLSEEEAVLS